MNCFIIVLLILFIVILVFLGIFNEIFFGNGILILCEKFNCNIKVLFWSWVLYLIFLIFNFLENFLDILCIILNNRVWVVLWIFFMNILLFGCFIVSKFFFNVMFKFEFNCFLSWFFGFLIVKKFFFLMLMVILVGIIIILLFIWFIFVFFFYY